MKAILTLVLATALPAAAATQLGTARPLQEKIKNKTSPPAMVTFGGGTILGGSDGCATPTSIAGQGVFLYDTTGATTGTEGQAECSGTINNDEWFEWTADASGTVTIRTCGLAAYDTELAAYPSGGCPANGTSLACNDDNCSLRSSISFSVSSGVTYLIQAGAYSPGTTGPSGLEITIVSQPVNDGCTAPIVIAGQGTFGFDTSGASKGTHGQNEGLCNFFGTGEIDRDVWFSWTADADGQATVSTCAGATNDTKLAAYPGTGCPIDGTALACNDDTCGLQSSICFDVVSGGVYTIQLGSFPGSGGAAGTFDISIGAGTSAYSYDSGMSTNSFGGPGGAMLWGQGFDAQGGADMLTEIATTYGTPLFPGLTHGHNARVLVYDDPNDDNDPTDAVLLYEAAVITANEDNDIFNEYAVPNVGVSGVFYIAVVAEYEPGQYPAPMDESCIANRSFFSANAPAFGGYAAFDYNNLNNNEVPATDMAGFGFPTNWLLRAEGFSGFTKYCSANNNSTDAPADLTGSGGTSASSGTVTMTSAPVPNQPGIFFHAANQSLIPFGCSFLCAAGGTVRGAVTAGIGNVATYVYDNSDAKHSLAGFVGSMRRFQYWFRDPMAHCGGYSFNTSNAVEGVITP